MLRFTLTCSMLTLAAACAPEGEKYPLLEADFEQAMIFQGASINQEYHEATVSIHMDYGFFGVTEPFCSGTLIFDRWILTAAHCVDGLSANQILVHFGEDGTNLGSNLYDVSRVIKNPAYNAATISNDTALIELATAATYTSPIMPLPASIGLTSADEGLTVDLAGFGLQENGAASELLYITKAIADVRSKEVEYDQGNGFGNSTGGACNGDSGGPAYFERNGAIYVAGITSYGDQNCTDFGVSMKVDAFEDFIESNTGLLVEEVSGGGTGGTPPTDVIEGTITVQGQLQAWSYITVGPGEHTAHLEGPAGTDFDLYLAQRVNNKWRIRARAETASTIEDLVYDAPVGGTFAVGVVAYSGTGDYTVDLTYPQ
jgi:V8-like Glu-specific endopeptidase